MGKSAMRPQTLIAEAEPMIKIACPHCQVLGEIPAIVLQNSDWPIACHHCHQHYFAPVVNGPEKLAHQKKIACSNCKSIAEIEQEKYEAILSVGATLYCPVCHHGLPLSKAGTKAKTTTPSIETLSPEKTENNTAKGSGQPAFPGWRSALFLLFAGFVLAALAMMAAQEGLIDRVWLDKLLSQMPDRQMIADGLRSLFPRL